MLLGIDCHCVSQTTFYLVIYFAFYHDDLLQHYHDGQHKDFN